MVMFIDLRREDGFTILEIVVAIVVAGIFSIGLTTMILNIQTVNDKAKDLVIANSFIQDKTEEIRAGGHVSLINGNYDITDELPNGLAPPRSATYVVADETINSSVANVGLKLITFNVQYDDDGSTRTIEYATYIGELGVGQY